MSAITAALITAIVSGPIAYLLGNRRVRFERLYERRAEVIARLSELLFLVQRGFLEWSSPFQSGEVDRDEQRRQASEAYHELVSYYRSNSIWLDPETCDKLESFLENAFTMAWEYADELNERGHPQNRTGREASIRMGREIPALRTELDTEFRAILYPPPWYNVPLRFLQRVQERNRQSSESGSGNADRVDTP